MKKFTTLFVSTMALGALIIPSQTFADTAAEYQSKGIIEFVPSDDPTGPKDPVDPGKDVNPGGPGGEVVNPGTNGPLSIDYASGLDFGVQKITSSDQTYYAAAQKYKMLDDQGNPVDPVKEGPNYAQVTDNRGTKAGWTLTVKQNGQFTSDTSGEELTGAQIKFSNGNIRTISTSGQPVSETSFTLNPDGSESKVMAASKGNGAGTFLNDWGTDATTGAKSIELNVPGSTTKLAEKYTTSFTWTLTDVPGN